MKQRGHGKKLYQVFFRQNMTRSVDHYWHRYATLRVCEIYENKIWMKNMTLRGTYSSLKASRRDCLYMIGRAIANYRSRKCSCTSFGGIAPIPVRKCCVCRRNFATILHMFGWCLKLSTTAEVNLLLMIEIPLWKGDLGRIESSCV